MVGGPGTRASAFAAHRRQQHYEALGEVEFVLPPELLAIVDSNRAAMVPFFRNSYAEVRKAWA